MNGRFADAMLLEDIVRKWAQPRPYAAKNQPIWDIF